MGEENGKERLVQYAIVVENSDYPYKQYFLVSEKKIEDAMVILDTDEKILFLGGDIDDIETNISGRRDISACFNKKRIGSLEIYAPNEYLANFAANSLKLPLPFPDKLNEDYREDEIRLG